MRRAARTGTLRGATRVVLPIRGPGEGLREALSVKLRLIAVGRLREPAVAAVARDFRKRLQRYIACDEVEITASHGADPVRAILDEGQRVTRMLEPDEPIWLLERSGTQLSSIELSARLTDSAASFPRLTLVIAGTYGASDELLTRATFRWSLSRLTFLHEWVRVLVLEQLYRAAKIARNEPYHH